MIRKIFPLVAILALMAGALIAQDKTVTLTGYLIDNACAVSHTTEKPLSTWVKDHPASCATMEDCEKSGYAVYADNKLYKFDEAGNASAKELLKVTKSKKGLHIKVEGTVDGDTIKVTKLTEYTAEGASEVKKPKP
jgi:type 1 fimbria pilin